MHLLIILLQQLLGMLPGSKKAPQAEVVRTRQPSSSSSESDAFQRLGVSQDGWMTILRRHEGADGPPPRAAALQLGRNPANRRGPALSAFRRWLRGTGLLLETGPLFENGRRRFRRL
jgi:hypothetical protein